LPARSERGVHGASLTFTVCGVVHRSRLCGLGIRGTLPGSRGGIGWVLPSTLDGRAQQQARKRSRPAKGLPSDVGRASSAAPTTTGNVPGEEEERCARVVGGRSRGSVRHIRRARPAAAAVARAARVAEGHHGGEGARRPSLDRRGRRLSMDGQGNALNRAYKCARPYYSMSDPRTTTGMHVDAPQGRSTCVRLDPGAGTLRPPGYG